MVFKSVTNKRWSFILFQKIRESEKERERDRQTDREREREKDIDNKNNKRVQKIIN